IIFFYLNLTKFSWFNNNTNIPFNLIFPTNNFQYEIIGFPNLVIPGILMTYCIRFDIFKYGKTFTTFGYFAVSVILYLFGLALALWTPLFSLQPLVRNLKFSLIPNIARSNYFITNNVHWNLAICLFKK